MVSAKYLLYMLCRSGQLVLAWEKLWGSFCLCRWLVQLLKMADRAVGLKSLPYGPQLQAAGSRVVDAEGAGWQQAQ